MSRYFIVMPDDSSQPILEAVNHASKSLRDQDVHIFRSVTFCMR